MSRQSSLWSWPPRAGCRSARRGLWNGFESGKRNDPRWRMAGLGCREGRWGRGDNHDHIAASATLQISVEALSPIRHLPSVIQIMCGRFGLTRPEALKLERFGITELPPLVPRYNIPPSSDILVVRER